MGTLLHFAACLYYNSYSKPKHLMLIILPRTLYRYRTRVSLAPSQPPTFVEERFTRNPDHRRQARTVVDCPSELVEQRRAMAASRSAPNPWTLDYPSYKTNIIQPISFRQINHRQRATSCWRSSAVAVAAVLHRRVVMR